MSRILWTVALAGVVLSVGVGLRAEGPVGKTPGFELKNGDRVVLLGNAFFERDHEYGYLETELTSIWPDRNIAFRNLGRTGDTVWGDAWAGFETPVEGFARRRDLVLGLKPTVLLIAFGMNESFAGEPGLSRFVEGLNALLDSLAPTEARVVLISPTLHEKLPAPLPDPTAHNQSLRLYRDAMAKVAHDRGLGFVDLLAAGVGEGERTDGAPSPTETEDGIHLNDVGYRKAARVLGSCLKPGEERVAMAFRPGAVEAIACEVSEVERTPEHLTFRCLDHRLPPAGDSQSGEAGRSLLVVGLPSGRSTLQVDDQPAATATEEQWSQGVTVRDSPELRQAEALRRAIVEKDRLLYYRWRPENETYLYGFRKHEQGQNAAEIPEFDPLVAEKEAEIAKLRKPVPHVYKLTADEVDRR